MPLYTPLLKHLARQTGQEVTWSPPELVSGSLNPPPSLRYPGATCYLVRVRIGPWEYSGFGRTSSVARSFAESKAYRDLYARVFGHERPPQGGGAPSRTLPRDVRKSGERRREEKRVVADNEDQRLMAFASECRAYFESRQRSRDINVPSGAKIKAPRGGSITVHSRGGHQPGSSIQRPPLRTLPPHPLVLMVKQRMLANSASANSSKPRSHSPANKTPSTSSDSNQTTSSKDSLFECSQELSYSPSTSCSSGNRDNIVTVCRALENCRVSHAREEQRTRVTGQNLTREETRETRRKQLKHSSCIESIDTIIDLRKEGESSDESGGWSQEEEDVEYVCEDWSEPDNELDMAALPSQGPSLYH